MRRRRYGMFRALGVVISAGSILVACDTNDGRDMKPPTSYEEWALQNTTPSTSTTSTTLAPPTTPAPIVIETLVDTVVDTAVDTAGTSVDGTGPGSSDAGSPLDTATSGPVDTFAEGLGLADLTDAGVEFDGPWPDGGSIPVDYTCTGTDDVPLLTWTAPPADAVEVALVVTDETAADFAHWIVIGLPPEAGSVGGPEPVTVGTEATNSRGEIGWAGPCPPDAAPHTYRFTLYALTQAIELPPESSAADLIQAIEASASGAASLTGIYQVA